MASCSDDDNKVEIQETDAAYVGKEVVTLLQMSGIQVVSWVQQRTLVPAVL